MSLAGWWRDWVVGSPRDREYAANRALWNETDALWQQSRPAHDPPDVFALEIIKRVMAEGRRLPAVKVLIECCIAAEMLLLAEDFGPIQADWPVIDADAAVALDIRTMLERRKRWATGFDQMLEVFERPLVRTLLRLFDELPEACFDEWDDTATPFSVPLIDLLDVPSTAIGLFMLAPYDDDTLRLDVFRRLRKTLERNMLAASGFPPDADPNAYTDRIIGPHEQRGKTPRQLLDLYLADTPFHRLLTLPVPFRVPESARFEHCHIIGGTGHGKTQLLQRMIHADLLAATEERRSVVVIDSQGDLITKLLRLDLFSPDRPGSLADRLILIDPADVEHPPALNLFDASDKRLGSYRPADRERIENGAIEVYETLFADLLGAELTQKQGVVFKYLARLMVSIPGATIHTLVDLMEDGRPYRQHMERLRGAPARFFATEFFHPSFSATKKQIARRLWGVLATPAFERILAQPEGKIDLFEALDRGSIILVSTAKEVLKDEGSALFGRFVIKLVAQAALERAVQPEADRTPTFLYVDEAQEYVDPSIEALLSQARKYRVGLTFAHQSLDQLSVSERAALLTNASLKCAGGVSAKDARALAQEMRTDAAFIEGMRRRRNHTEFAIWLKHHTPRAVQLTVPLGFLERQPTLDEESFDALLARNRDRYCGSRVEPPSLPARLWEPEPEDTPTPRPAPPPRTEPPPVRREAASRDAVVRSPRDEGSGGQRHRYLQNLVKQIADQQGFRSTIEAALPGGGQADVLLQQGDRTIAVEVSVTTPHAWEAGSVRNRLAGGADHVVLVVSKTKGFAAFRRSVLAGLTPEEAERVSVLVPEDVPDALALLAPPPEPGETMVRGYKVRVSHTAVSPDNAKARRSEVARILSRSLGRED